MQNTAAAKVTHSIALLLVVVGVLLALSAATEAAGNTLATVNTPAVCTTDADCAAWDAAHGIVSDGTPGGERVPAQAGDDNADGTIDESESGWQCDSMGDRICGIGVDGGPVLMPAADGGIAYTCPIGMPLSFTTEGERPVCDYSALASA